MSPLQPSQGTAVETAQSAPCSDYNSLLISIHASQHQLIGMADGWVRRMDAIDTRQAESEERFEHRLELLEEKHATLQTAIDQRLDATWAKINQAIGVGKAFGIVVMLVSLIATIIQIYTAVK